MSNQVYDVIIIGAGFAGISTAYYLSQSQQLRILLLEKENSFGIHASGKNAAMLRQGVKEIEIASLIQETVQSLKKPPLDWSEKQVFRPTGSLLLGEEKSIQQIHKTLTQLSVSSEMFRNGNLPHYCPKKVVKILKTSRYESLLSTPSDGVVDIHALLRNLLSAAQKRGVEIRYDFEANQINKKGPYFQIGDHEHQFEGVTLVNASGAWATDLGNKLAEGMKPLIPFRRHLFISEPIQDYEESLPLVWDIQREYYFRPESKAWLLCPGDETIHPATDPQTDPQALELLAEKLNRYCPELSTLSIQRSWACLRTKSPDGHFRISMSPQTPGFFWVAALAGHGMSASMGVGKKAAFLIQNYLQEMAPKKVS